MHHNLFKTFFSVLESFLKISQQWERWVFPYFCVICLKASDTTSDLCLSCRSQLPTVEKSCKCCANRLVSMHEPADWICGKCIKTPPAYNEILSVFEYATPVDYLVQQLKFGKKLLYASVLGGLMAEHFASHYQTRLLPQCILPVPLHRKRLKERGFNQSLELARPIAKKLNIPLEPFLYQRVRNTLQQSHIPMNQRRHNVDQAFIKSSSKCYQHVAIIDDVVTTGFTVDALSKTLKKNGVKEVTVWCCARTCS